MLALFFVVQVLPSASAMVHHRRGHYSERSTCAEVCSMFVALASLFVLYCNLVLLDTRVSDATHKDCADGAQLATQKN